MAHPDQAFGDKTYSQFGEDLILLNVFHKLGITKGKYFDIGAHHPHNISNTALLYDRGWRGLCVEANPKLIEAFKIHRPEDLLMNVGVGPNYDMLTFYMIDDYSGRNSFNKITIDVFTKDYPEFEVTGTVDIHVVTLDSLYDQMGIPDLLCIDIEGLDYDALEASSGRPKIICVENEGRIKEFDDLLKSKGYDKIFNTLGNGIYLHEAL